MIFRNDMVPVNSQPQPQTNLPHYSFALLAHLALFLRLASTSDGITSRSALEKVIPWEIFRRRPRLSVDGGLLSVGLSWNVVPQILGKQ